MTTLKIACASLLLLSGVMAASCSSDTETEAADRVEVSGLDDTVRFTYDAAESVAFTVASNKTWSIAKNGLDWLTVSQMNGGSKLPATVRLTAEANDDLERSGHLTIYAGALAQTVTVTQEACPVVPTITLGGLADNTIAFEFTDTEPVTFKLYANIDWTADKQNLGWAEVAPLSGARKQEATITVTPTANPGDAREGSVSFRAEGMEPVVVTVRQAAYRDEPMLVVTGADENRLAFANTPEAPTALHILCNRGWTITKTDLDWLTVSPAAGTASAEPAEVTLTAEPNDGAARSGTLTVRADDPALADVVITVSQAAKGNPLLAWWTLSDETLKTVNAGWPASGKILPDQPAGTTAYGQWNHVAQTPDYTTKLIISSDGKGHYAIQQIWTEDNMEFVIPVKNFAAGTSVNFRCGMSGTGTAPKYWSIDYFDQGEWKTAGTQEFTFPIGDKRVTATFELTGANAETDIDQTVTFTQPVADGSVRIRLRCADGACRTDGKSLLTKPGSAGTIRLRQWSTGELDAIAFPRPPPQTPPRRTAAGSSHRPAARSYNPRT